MDGECTYNNSSDRLRCAVTSMGNVSIGLGCRTSDSSPLLHHHLLHFLSTYRLLPHFRSNLRQKKLHLQWCCQIHLRSSFHSFNHNLYIHTYMYVFTHIYIFCIYMQITNQCRWNTSLDVWTVSVCQPLWSGDWLHYHCIYKCCVCCSIYFINLNLHLYI